MEGLGGPREGLRLVLFDFLLSLIALSLSPRSPKVHLSSFPTNESCIHLASIGSLQAWSGTTPRPDPPGSLCQAPSIGPPLCPRPDRSHGRGSPSILSRLPDRPPFPAPWDRPAARVLLISCVSLLPGSDSPALCARPVHPAATC